MPIPPIAIPAIIGAVGNFASNAGNSVNDFMANQQNLQFQGQMNQRNIEFQEKWNRQNRQWAIDDWNRNNAYNSPVQQMQRLREAGLNPNLVYGNGATNTAQMVSRTEGKAPQVEKLHVPNTPAQPIGDIVNDFMSVKIQSQQLENMIAQNELIKKQITSKDISNAATAMQTAKTEFQLKQARSLYDTTIEAAKLGNEFKRLQIELKPQEFQLKAEQLKLQQARTGAELDRIHADILLKFFENQHIQPAKLDLIKKQIDVLREEGTLRKWQAKMSELGVAKNDPWYIRIFTNAFKYLNTEVPPYKGDGKGVQPYRGPKYHQ